MPAGLNRSKRGLKSSCALRYEGSPGRLSSCVDSRLRSACQSAGVGPAARANGRHRAAAPIAAPPSTTLRRSGRVRTPARSEARRRGPESTATPFLPPLPQILASGYGPGKDEIRAAGGPDGGRSVLAQSEVADQHADGHQIFAVPSLAGRLARRGDLLEYPRQLLANGHC